MAQPYSTGPVYVWCAGPALGGTPTFLGTAESFPRQEHHPHFGEVKNDLSGTDQGMDVHFQGQEAMVSLTLTYWNDPVLRALENLLPGRSPTGGYFANDLGTMMQTEGFAIPLWLVYPAAVLHAAMGTLPAGYRYPNTIFRGPWSNEGGAKEMKRQAIFHARPFRSIDNNGNMLFQLYDYNMSALPNGGLAIN